MLRSLHGHSVGISKKSIRKNPILTKQKLTFDFFLSYLLFGEVLVVQSSELLTICSTSLPGGNLVDGLPPGASIEVKTLHKDR